MSEPTIRPYHPDDQKALEVFFREVWSHTRFPFDPEGAHGDLRRIPDEYGTDGGGFWLLSVGGEIIGTVALRRLADGTAELKRLNVRSAYRRRGLGDRLVTHAIGHARAAGFRAVRLDTISNLGPAPHLFRKHGFSEIPRYNENPDADLFMELSW